MAGTSCVTPATAPSLYPSPSLASLKLQFVGKHLNDVPTPAAIIDAAVVRQNCNLMLDAANKLDVGFRAHVKTHKTTEIAKLQVGEASRAVKLVCSTVGEVENLVPWLLECKAQGKQIDVLYGLPVARSSIPRLAAVARLLGPGSVAIFVDHPAQARELDSIDPSMWPGKIPAWVNIDVGYHREGVTAGSAQLAGLAAAMSASKRLRLAGLYTHFGSSYSSSSSSEALEYFAQELEGLRNGAESFLQSVGKPAFIDSIGSTEEGSSGKVTLSLGATPTATSLQNLFEDSTAARKYRDMLEKAKETFAVEIHAGVYPVMDMQQLATRARPQRSTNDPSKGLLDYSQLGLRMLVEVVGLYPDRTDKPEALVAAGSLALGREPCKSYEGWAVVTPWPEKSGEHYDPEGSRTGWIVGRISQEHGNLTWEGSQDNVRQLEYGQKLMLWPNHACIASAHYGWYVVVDSEKGDPDIVQDVWLRCRGW